MRIILLIVLAILVVILIRKLTSRTDEQFANMLNFDNIEKSTETDKTVTVYLTEQDSGSFHPKYTISNSQKKPYLFVNDFWELYNLKVDIQDKDRNVVSQITHYNYNIYNFTIDGLKNKFQYINNNNKKLMITSDNKQFSFVGNSIIYGPNDIGTFSGDEVTVKVTYEKYKNIFAIGYMIYKQLMKEESQVQI